MIKKGYATDNPCHGLELPGGQESPHEKDWTDTEIKAVWNALDEEDPITRALFQIAFLTACRRGELLQAEWSWMDFEKELLRVPAKANKAPRDCIVQITKAAAKKTITPATRRQPALLKITINAMIAGTAAMRDRPLEREIVQPCAL